MVNNAVMKNSIAFVAATMLGCVSSSSHTVKQEPASLSCDSLNLQEKVGFLTALNPENKEGKLICYKIMSDGYYFTDHFIEYVATCNRVPGSIACYRDFAGPNKDEMRLELFLDADVVDVLFRGVPASVSFWRSPSGVIRTFGTAIPANINKGFETCERALDMARDMVTKVPRICKELQEYKKK
ncbi:hypothetical protein HZB03_00595 [Candidatus Woesearchaeota archaeon]|nr:hypothetical protein [Candidatus Woesearchaeota archaeon]